MDEETSTSPPDAVTFGLAFGGTVLVAMVLMFGAAVAWANKKGADAKRGWTLVPVVKATRDLRAGTTLSAADFAVGDLPEQFVTPSLVTPSGAASLLGQTLQVPVKQGDALWSAYVVPRARLDTCATLVRAAAGASADAPEVRELINAVENQAKARRGSPRVTP